MRKSELTRYKNTINDLLELGVNDYCDLGPGKGEIAIKLKQKGKNVCCLEAPWDFQNRTRWSKKHEINVFKGEFFSSSFQKVINQKVQCFSLVHAIAHFRFPPHIVLKEAYNKLEKNGYFYLSTVNGGSLDRVLKLFRGRSLTEEVHEHVEMGDEYMKYCNPSGKFMIWDSWMHVKEYRDYELKKIFEDCGFKVVKLFHRNNFKHWKQTIMTLIWPHLSEEIIIIGQKI